jgi:hypothetical protein
VSAEKRKALWQFAGLIERDYGECATTGGLPVDGQVLRIDLFADARVSQCKQEDDRQGSERRQTLTRLVSQAFVETRRLS